MTVEYSRQTNKQTSGLILFINCTRKKKTSLSPHLIRRIGRALPNVHVRADKIVPTGPEIKLLPAGNLVQFALNRSRENHLTEFRYRRSKFPFSGGPEFSSNRAKRDVPHASGRS